MSSFTLRDASSRPSEGGVLASPVSGQQEGSGAKGQQWWWCEMRTALPGAGWVVSVLEAPEPQSSLPSQLPVGTALGTCPLGHGTSSLERRQGELPPSLDRAPAAHPRAGAGGACSSRGEESHGLHLEDAGVVSRGQQASS